MKNAKIVAEWDESTGGAIVDVYGNEADVFALLAVITAQIFDDMKLSDANGLLHLARCIGFARKTMLAKVDLDALKHAKEQRDE